MDVYHYQIREIDSYFAVEVRSADLKRTTLGTYFNLQDALASVPYVDWIPASWMASLDPFRFRRIAAGVTHVADDDSQPMI